MISDWVECFKSKNIDNYWSSIGPYDCWYVLLLSVSKFFWAEWMVTDWLGLTVLTGMNFVFLKVVESLECEFLLPLPFAPYLWMHKVLQVIMIFHFISLVEGPAARFKESNSRWTAERKHSEGKVTRYMFKSCGMLVSLASLNYTIGF